MFWRALLAFLVLPGTVAFLVPLVLIRPGVNADSFRASGLIPVVIGSVLLVLCVRDFYVSGKGTLAPWSPPRNLVVVGLYRLSRNPMYVAVIVILCGWALTFRSVTLWVYALAIAVIFHLRVVFGEEPWLARTHGEAWVQYRNRIPRWLI
jgi:protein-S-isoprenylcysteine O-methyltransferase Ste14